MGDGFPTTAQGKNYLNDDPHYRGVISNHAIAKYLAQDLTVETNTRVTNIHWANGLWTVETNTSKTYDGDVLLMTPPIPQALTLLIESKIDVPEEFTNRLENVAYHRCIALLALLKSRSKIPSPGAVRMSGEPIKWIADNQKKGISPNGVALIIHAGAQFSLNHWDDENEKIVQCLLSDASAERSISCPIRRIESVLIPMTAIPAITYG